MFYQAPYSVEKLNDSRDVVFDETDGRSTQ